MSKSKKLHEAEEQLENREHYEPLEAPMAKTTQKKINEIIDKLHRVKHINDMTINGFYNSPVRREFLFSTR